METIPAFTCWDCGYRVGEECDVYGHEVYEDSEPCEQFFYSEED